VKEMNVSGLEMPRSAPTDLKEWIFSGLRF